MKLTERELKAEDNKFREENLETEEFRPWDNGNCGLVVNDEDEL